MKESLEFIYKEQKELGTFGGIGALLGWDQMTYMPIKGNDERAEQLSLISRLAHQKVVSDEFYNHIQTLNNNHQSLTQKDQLVVTRLKQDIDKARKIPASFVEKMTKTTTLAYTRWQEAREKNQYQIFAPYLEQIIELEKEYCDLIQLPGHPYNSLLDDYEEDMTAQKLKQEFTTLKPHLTKLLHIITASKTYKQQKPLTIEFTRDQQQTLCHHLITLLNLPPEQSRLDVSTHPFTTTLADDDVRITTNFEHKQPLFSFLSTVHEAGHALYELGLPRGEYQHTIISDTPSLGLHESQSRFWENMIARSKPFWNFYAPVFQNTAVDQCQNMTSETWYRSVNQVRPSLIRIEADELTYCLHVILRFELELDLIDNKITVQELPQRWNEKTTELLGVTPTNDTEGVLQDMHWSTGEFGYFPTYAIGTIYATQLYKKLIETHPQTSEEITQGNFTNILSWLRENIHQYGRMMTADDIIKKTCGEGLNSQVYLAYLKDKYSLLYDLS
ncbi:MAG: carboxypeptidase M32 [Methanobacteriota archaeon]